MLKPGDAVRPHGGGPLMCVALVTGRLVRTVWHTRLNRRALRRRHRKGVPKWLPRAAVYPSGHLQREP